MTNPLPTEVEMVLDGLKRAGDQWLAICPTHPDRNPSLALRVNEEGKLLVNCFAGCDPVGILRAIGYEPPERPQRGEWTPNGEAIAVYDYRDESGELLYQVLRTADKHFSQRRPDPTAKSGWRYSLGDTRRVLYRLPELVAAVAEGRSVCIAEGERDVQALVGAGFVATTNSGGAGKWRPEFAQHFTGANVTIFADKDEPGQRHARAIARSLEGVAASWKIVEAADPHKDIAAHLGAGLTPAQVVTTATSAGPVRVDLAPDLLELLEADEPEYDWLIPGLLERGDRVILTGSEGFGKSTWLRQLSVMFASGVHPVTFELIDPVRVLVVDCENGTRLNRRKYRPLVAAMRGLQREHPHGNLRIIHRPEGLALDQPQDAAWLLERVTAHRPDMLVLGPLYRLHVGPPKEEEVARAVVQAIDAARIAANCAVFLEAHSPHPEAGRNRSVRPLGSSLYLRWPEFGLGLRLPRDAQTEDFAELNHWRGDRDERNWPPLLRRTGQILPWEPADWEIYHEMTDNQGPQGVTG